MLFLTTKTTNIFTNATIMSNTLVLFVKILVLFVF